MFSREDFERLAEQLSGISGRFVMSINDRPEIRELFGRFDLAKIETTYSVGTKRGARRPVQELLVANTPLGRSGPATVPAV